MENPLDQFPANKGVNMVQNILLAMDDSDNAQRAAAFVARVFSPENKITLFNVMLDTAALCSLDSPELTPLFKSHQSSFCALEDKKRELVDQAMQKARETLLNAGFNEENIKIKVENKKKGVARDIVAESQKGYDLIVLGRHGISGVKEFFLGSTAQKVFNAAKEISVLIAN
jgi:nucleotide-binding universal stress UspA family protein